MKIAILASEGAPYIKSGGLGDVMEALPSALGKIPGNEVVLILPYYSAIGGWVLKYLAAYLTGNGMNAVSDTYFTGFITATWEGGWRWPWSNKPQALGAWPSGCSLPSPGMHSSATSAPCQQPVCFPSSYPQVPTGRLAVDTQ